MVNQFAIHLQKVESKIFIDKICKALVTEDIIPLTIHDGLIVPKESRDITLEIMKEILFNEIGYSTDVQFGHQNINFCVGLFKQMI
jgi:hypothetical protein